MALFSGILDLLLDFFRPIIKPLNGALNIVEVFTGKTKTLLDRIEHLVQSSIDSYNGFKNFTLKTGFSSRVMQPNEAFNNLTDLITRVPQDVLEKVKSLIKRFQQRYRELTANVSGEGVAEAAELAEIEGAADFKAFVVKVLGKFGGKVAKIGERIFTVLGFVLDAIIFLSDTVDDLQGIVDDIEEVRRDLNKLDGVFLQQNNARVWVTLEDGNRIRRRVGKLLKQ